MTHLQYFNYPGFGEHARKNTRYSQSVRIDNRIEISGQGGWDRQTFAIPSDISEEIAQAFENVQHALENAGGKGWSQVYKSRIYVVADNPKGFSDIGAIGVQNLRKWCPDHAPLLTCVQVFGLHSNMRIEIEVEAHLG